MLTRFPAFGALAALALAGCANPGGGTSSTDETHAPGNEPGDAGGGLGPGGDPGGTNPGGAGDDSGAANNGDDTAGGGETSGGGGDTAPPQASTIRFVVLGDAGTGDDNQFAVAKGMETVCATSGCDFALYVGDNFYSDGVSSIDDTQFQTKFEQPYANLDFPFYAVPGNHDYGGGGGGYDTWRTDLEVEYTTHSTKWKMPDQYYRFEQGNATFIGLDTTALDWGNTTEQAQWLPSELAASTTTWKFAFGHHPYFSNGQHGNANSNFGPFFESYLCGNIDVYFAGHDHDLEWIQSTCSGTEQVVSGGGGAGLYSLNGSNPSYFESESHGFLWVEIDGNTFTGVFYDQDGNELFRRTITK